MMYSDSLPAHNAENLLVHFRRVECLKSKAMEFKSVCLNPKQLCDLEMLLNRAFYPLEGYLCSADYESVLERMRLSDGTLWPLPICLGVEGAFAETLSVGENLAIRDAEGFMLAVLTVSEIWKPDLHREVLAIWGNHENAWGANAGHAESNDVWYLGGRVEGLAFPQRYDFVDMRLTPAETHRYFTQKGWRKTIAVQADRPLHKADYAVLEAAALEEGASLLISPLVSPSMYSNVDHFNLVRCFQGFSEAFSRNVAKMNLVSWFDRGMGSRGVLLQAVVNRNYGCTHMFVWNQDLSRSRNGEFSCDVMGILKEFEDETGIIPVAELPVAYDRESCSYNTNHEGITCSEGHEHIVDMLLSGQVVPEYISFPAVMAELKRRYKPRSQQGFTLFFTGLSGAGKSTLAKVLYVKLLEMTDRPVTLLDGDIVRTNLSSELTFSKEHRELNVTRIGYVASEIVKNGGVAVCAPIAPYPNSRRQARAMSEQHGGFIQIHVSTPLEICERRDRKGLYAKARAGLVKGVTGIDDPYIAPEDPEIQIDTSEMTPNEAAHEIMMFLADKKYI